MTARTFCGYCGKEVLDGAARTDPRTGIPMHVRCLEALVIAREAVAARPRCETGGGIAARHMAAVEALATAIVAALPQGYSVAFALVHDETGAMVASALPALEVPQIASIFERCTATLRGGVVQQSETHLYDRRDGSRVKKESGH